MRAVMVDVPEHLLAERHRLGHDKADEMWEGELHMVPPGSNEHYRIELELAAFLLAMARTQGLQVRTEAGVFDPLVPEPTSYRQPDVVVFGDEASSERGVEGRARLVVEIRSPGDESFDKLPFYGRVGVAEVLIVDRDTKGVRRWVNRAGTLEDADAGDGGWHSLDALPLAVRGVAETLQLRSADQTVEI